MRGMHPAAYSLPELRENLRVLTERVEELYFQPAFYAGDGSLANGALLTTFQLAATVEFPKGAADPDWRIERLRLADWRAAYARISVRYTAGAGSTNAFVLSLRLREHGPGDVHPTALLASTDLVMPGPAVANTEMLYQYVTPTFAINGAKSGITFGHIRRTTHASDTNAGSLYVFSVLWEVLPA